MKIYRQQQTPLLTSTTVGSSLCHSTFGFTYVTQREAFFRQTTRLLVNFTNQFVCCSGVIYM